MSTFSLFPIPTLPHHTSYAPSHTLSLLSPSSMNLLKLHHIPRRLSAVTFRRISISAAAVRQDTNLWSTTPLISVSPEAESLFHISIDVSDYPELASSYTKPGQYLQLRVPNVEKPSFLAIASPPKVAVNKGVFEFLVKSVSGSTAELLCGLNRGDAVELSQVMGNGFDLDQISPAETYQTVVIFATGSGISPIRSLIEAGFGADKRSDVRLYYGARNLKRMGYQVCCLLAACRQFLSSLWQKYKVVPVLSQPDNAWKGERGYVQAAFSRAKNIFTPQSTGAVLCGQKQMAEEVTSLLVADGVSTEKILKNF
ncbi:fruit protein isoform X2 [Capsicum chacoense]